MFIKLEVNFFFFFESFVCSFLFLFVSRVTLVGNLVDQLRNLRNSLCSGYELQLVEGLFCTCVFTGCLNFLISASKKEIGLKSPHSGKVNE